MKGHERIDKERAKRENLVEMLKEERAERNRLIEEERKSRLEFETNMMAKFAQLSQQMGTNQVIIVLCLQNCKIYVAYLHC